MPRRRNGELPLPAGWDVGRDYDGKLFFIDHNNKQTTWIDPRDRFTKPQTFADCIGNELPWGWEQTFDSQIGLYFINHIKQSTQLEDPRLEWRAIQEAMLREYLQTAHEELEAKKEILDIKQQRLCLAQDDYQHLNNALSNLHNSRTSLCSNISSASSKYDPDLLKADVALAKHRVSRLKHELQQIQVEMVYKQRGVDTLAHVENKLAAQGSVYNISEAQAIVCELRSIQKSLSSGEKEKAELMQSLVKLKDDLTRLQLSESSPDISTLSLPNEKLSTASQTDLSGELIPIGTRLAEMARMRLEYDEARKTVQQIQHRLADLEGEVIPGQVESDKDRLLLYQEKEQLLRELRSITPHSRSQKDMQAIKAEIKKLEQDLNNATEMSNRAIADRLRLHEEKQLLLQQLKEALQAMAQLESQLKHLSASTLSMSSSSSLGSLSTSSKGSLSSLSFTDIYGMPQCTHLEQVNMLDLHRRVERLLHSSDSESALPVVNEDSAVLVMNSQNTPQLSLSPRSSLSSVSPPVSPYELGLPPPYEQSLCSSAAEHWRLLAERVQLEERLSELRVTTRSTGSVPGLRPFQFRPVSDFLSNEGGIPITVGSSNSDVTSNPPLSPISESVSDCHVLMEVEGRKRSSNTRSVSAAVSDESVAGDSGVFEASNKHSSDEWMHLETAQVLVKLRYSIDDDILHIGIERARNLTALSIPDKYKICIKAALLPSTTLDVLACSTKPTDDTNRPTFGENFPLNVPLSKLYTKTLQITVWAIGPATDHGDCMGSAQVSLADFDPETPLIKWYNILSFSFMVMENRTTESNNNTESNRITPTSEDNKQDQDISSYRSTNTKEESSDESTIISSQTSTLTRNQDPDSVHSVVGVHKLDGHCDECYSDDNEDESDDECDRPLEDEEMIRRVRELAKCEMESKMPLIVETLDKETNTECVFIAERGVRRHLEESNKSIVIKRSQTFSPSVVVGRTQYSCRLSRSDSDSSMPLYRKGGPFQRNSVERRSLRWKKPPGAPPTHTKSCAHAITARTSIDLELDLQAQQTKLQQLQDELERLRVLKQHLEDARGTGDTEVTSWILEDEHFQTLLSEATHLKNGKNTEDKKVERLMKKTSREIYKLRKTKAGNGQPDIISFKEKMAFFTRVNLNVPVLTDESEMVNKPEQSSQTECESRFAFTDQEIGVEV